MYSSLKYVRQLLALLKVHGVTKFVVSPGSRHIPIVFSMQADPAFQLYSIVDERSASFFALGLIQRYNTPVGIICTSGTASANYTSAISEAYFQELPLLVITADRLSCYHYQLEDQTIPQQELFQPITKCSVTLPDGERKRDEWHANRLINQALLELNHHGRVPVHINVPVLNHVEPFDALELPDERVIRRYNLQREESDWTKDAELLSSKKILIIIGQGQPLSKEETDILNHFTSDHNVAILADKMSNCHAEYTIENAFCALHAINHEDLQQLRPGLTIFIRANYSFNGESKSFLASCGCKESWFVSPTGEIRDPFHTLTRVYEMNEFAFFEKINQATTRPADQENQYGAIWQAFSLSMDIPVPEYGQLYAIAETLQHLPAGSTLNLANSNAVRMAQIFDLDKSIIVHGNRGTAGIDGCMSSFIGMASCSSRPAFLIIGDLTFFYDMNALWNQYIGPNIRILLCNNSGGGIMHMPERPEVQIEMMPSYISAANHDASAKAWAQDRGFKYLCASDKAQFDSVLQEFVTPESDCPIILEVFSDMKDDVRIFKEFYSRLNPHIPTLKEKIVARFPTPVVAALSRIKRVFV